MEALTYSNMHLYYNCTENTNRFLGVSHEAGNEVVLVKSVYSLWQSITQVPHTLIKGSRRCLTNLQVIQAGKISCRDQTDAQAQRDIGCHQPADVTMKPGHPTP